MPIDSTPSGLTEAAKCYCYGNRQTSDAVLIYLLAEIAGDTSSPKELASKASCFCFGDQKMRDAIMIYLLCAIADAQGA